MKIFWVQFAGAIDLIVQNNKEKYTQLSYEEIIRDLNQFGFSSLFGLDKNRLFKDIFTNVTNSEYIQKKWADENGFNYNELSWQQEILAAQIEAFQPDVIYTGNFIFFDKKMKKMLPHAQLYALWNASPMPDNVDLSHFDLGLSFNEIYQNHLRQRGVAHIEYNSFYIDADIKNRLDAMHLKKTIDISFCGRHSHMFAKRNQFLFDIYREFKGSCTIEYYLWVQKRVKGLIPMIPFKLLGAYKSAVFLEDMFKVFRQSKIVLNAHSNITGVGKGNMRVFEVLGSGSFMLSDAGVYPKYLQEGEDFIAYSDTQDMLDKISYFLEHDKEREAIALNGFKKITQHYNTAIGTQNLEMIFGKYL